MSTCPACKEGKLKRVGDTYQCNDAECGYIEQMKVTKAQRWLLNIAKNDKTYWRREFFDNLPTFLAHEYRRLWLMARRPNVFCMVYQLKDVGEVLLKFPVLCAAALLKNETIDELLVKKVPAIGDWNSMCEHIISKYDGHYRYEIPQCLRNILEGIHKVYAKTNLAAYRNDYLGHGAMGFEDNEEYRAFGENLIACISEYLGNVMSDYAQLSVTVGTKKFNGWRVPKNIDVNAMPVLHIDGREIPLYPYIVNTEKYGVLFFDNYNARNDRNTAQGLNYMIGGGRKRFVAPYYSELYSRRFENIINTANENAPVDGDVMDQKIKEVLNELNAAENFVRPEYIIKWISEWLGDDKGSVNLLKMERGMGKTSLSYALAAGKIKEFQDAYIGAYYCGQSQIQSDYIMGINKALCVGISEEKTNAFVRLERDSKDKQANMIASLQYFLKEHTTWHGNSKLLLIIDGLDELPLASSDLFDFLPDAENMPDNTYILLTSRNPERETLAPHAVNALKSLKASNAMTVSTEVKNEHSEENLAVLKKYAESKIKVLSGGSSHKLNKKDVKRIVELSRGAFLNLKLYAKLAESGIEVKDLPKLEDEALFRRYLDEINKYYGDKLFGEAVTVLYAIVTAVEDLTIEEVAWLSGEKHVTLKLLAFIKDFGALLKTTRDTRRGSLVSAASERYRGYIEKLFPEKRAELAEIFTDALTNTDLKQYRDAQGNYTLPDGLIYIAAYLPTVLDEIPEELLNKVRYDIDKCIVNNRERHILSRRANLGEVWSEYCEKAGFYKKQLDFMKIAGDSHWYMCDYRKALEFRDKMVELSQNYFESGKIDDENYVATAYMNRGLTYWNTGKYDEALDDYRNCIDIMERLHSNGKLYDENDLAKAYMNRGGTYWNTGKYDEALDDYRKCIDIMERLHKENRLYDENELATAYMDRGVTYGTIGQHKEALDDYRKCIDIMERLHSKGKLYDLYYLATVMLNKGILLIDGFNDKDGALATFNEAIAMLEAEERLSYSADNTLRKLRYQRDRLTK